jgi:hypothetical protein
MCEKIKPLKLLFSFFGELKYAFALNVLKIVFHFISSCTFVEFPFRAPAQADYVSPGSVCAL